MPGPRQVTVQPVGESKRKYQYGQSIRLRTQNQPQHGERRPAAGSSAHWAGSTGDRCRTAERPSPRSTVVTLLAPVIGDASGSCETPAPEIRRSLPLTRPA